mgnify:CR=1 FL=1
MDMTHPLFCFFIFFSSDFFSSDYTELTEHSCSTDYSRIFKDLALRPLANAVAFQL